MHTRRWWATGLAILIATGSITGCGKVAAKGTSATYPVKGRTVTLIVPYDAGGAGDVGARLLAPYLEKELGTNVEVVNRPGAGSQIGVSELARAKPDGYTIGFTHLPATITTYLDPKRKADFTAASLAPVAMYVIDPTALAVKADSPLKTINDLVAAAKARPGQVTITDSGILSDGHIVALRLEQMAGVKFAIVHGNGGAQNVTNILGGHDDVANLNLSGNTAELVRSGQIRLLAICDSQPDPNFPGVQTATEQNFPLVVATSRAISAPAGTPADIVNKLSDAIKRAMANPEFKAKAQKSALRLSYMDPSQLKQYWSTMETDVKPLISIAR